MGAPPARQTFGKPVFLVQEAMRLDLLAGVDKRAQAATVGAVASLKRRFRFHGGRRVSPDKTAS